MDKSYIDDIIDHIKNIETEGIEFTTNKTREVKNEVTEKQKTYFWIRLYIRDENLKINESDDVLIDWSYGEKLNTKFIGYGKKGLDKNHDAEITSVSEDDKKILLLMVDSDDTNHNDDIPFLRSLFRGGYHYEEQIIRRSELIFTIDGAPIDYYDVDF